MFLVSFSICWLSSCFPLLCMYPPDVPSLSVHPPHCSSPFFCCQTPSFKKKKTFSPFLSLQNLRASFQSPLSFPLFISFCETTSVFSPFWFRLFSCIFQSCSFEKKTPKKKTHFPHTQNCFFWISSRFKGKSQKLFLQHSLFDFSGRLRKCIFHFCFFWKTSFSFGERWAKQKLKFFQVSLLVFSHVCKRISLSLQKKPKFLNRNTKESKQRRKRS